MGAPGHEAPQQRGRGEEGSFGRNLLKAGIAAGEGGGCFGSPADAAGHMAGGYRR